MKHFTANGGNIVKEQKYSTGDKDFKGAAHLDQGREARCHLRSRLLRRGLAHRASRRKQLGIKAPLLGGDGWVGDSLLKVAGNALDGSFLLLPLQRRGQEPGGAGLREKVSRQNTARCPTTWRRSATTAR